MVRTLFRTAGVFALAALTAAAPALADPGDSIFGTTVHGANIAIKNALTQQTIAQVPPVEQQPVGSNPQTAGLPTGFTYTLDFSVAKPYGNIGNKTGPLQGGMDVVTGYGFSPTTRLVANYYELQHYPYGFNSGTVPVYLQGYANPISTEDLSTAGLDLTTKDRFLLLNLEQMIRIGLPKHRVLPLVITPTYVSRWSTINQAGNDTDIVPFEANPTSAFPLTNVNTRTAQLWSVALTVPFLKTPKMFGTFTLAPTWLEHLNGLNQQNHAQLYQVLYLEYTPTSHTTIFFEPQSSRDYLPTDTYAQHLVAYFLGVSQKIGPTMFVQAVLNSGSPTNESPYGISSLVCQQLPCASNQVVPVIGGLKATQIQLKVGIGSPAVIQF